MERRSTLTRVHHFLKVGNLFDDDVHVPRRGISNPSNDECRFNRSDGTEWNDKRKCDDRGIIKTRNVTNITDRTDAIETAVIFRSERYLSRAEWFVL